MKLENIVIVSLALLLFSCQGKDGADGAIGPSLNGQIIGRIQLRDTLGDYKYLSNAFVQLVGTNYSTYSDSYGVWKLSGVKTGTYIISCSKTGYSNARNTSYQFIGGDQPADGGVFTVYPIPYRYIKIFNTPKINQHYLTIDGTLSSPLSSSSNYESIITFCGFDSNYLDLTNNYISVNYPSFPVNTENFSAFFDIETLKEKGVKSGSKLFFVTYVKSDPGYFDVQKQKYIYTGLCLTPSTIVSAIIP